MSIIEFAKKKLEQETSLENYENYNLGYVRYWVGYIDGATAQLKECERGMDEAQRPYED